MITRKLTLVAIVQNWYAHKPNCTDTGSVNPDVDVNDMKEHPNSLAQHRRKAVAARIDVSTE